MAELKDIKDIVEVQDYSLILLILLILAIIFLFGISLYLFKNRRKKRKIPNPKVAALNKLNNIDYTNPKEVVYTFQEQCELFLNEENKQNFYKIKQELEVYKYIKDVPDINTNLEYKIKEFIKGLK